ncbi:alpha-L-fucosidase [Carboxylicivirga marina]|uniref:alpha-L-fucosidase n=1 Tax=Carboxylicivirga marina TaxID=2800988 RepID=A0ABS1HP99_9BACT|nr:alpha-L-fucosidase [Carboxylicivirga marina]MBK3519516.1 alpha-L-fucosidase [Carboxylicivirga marina]
MKTIKALFIVLLLALVLPNFAQELDLNNLPFPTGGKDWDVEYSPKWEDLRTKEIPEWMIDAKYGVYTHWGVYSVPAHGGPDYVNELYMVHDKDDKKGVKEYHRNKYGKIADVGYADLVPMFKAEKFNADEWAGLMKQSGAKFGGICVVHHDGFCLWDSKATRWNAKNMGPKKDIYGEIAKAVRKQDMKLIATFHHARTYGYAIDRKNYKDYTDYQKSNWDLFDPEFADFYRNDYTEAMDSFGNEWFDKVNEVVDQYDPDVLWFDGLSGAMIKGMLPQERVINLFDRHYNKGEDKMICNKLPGSGVWNFPSGVGIRCYEGGRDMEPDPKGYWMIDRAISYPWSYVKDKKYRDHEDFHIRTIIDVTSRGGVYLLSLTPKGDGSISETEQKIMKGIGTWMDLNGEAIFATRKWRTHGEGEAKIVQIKPEKELVWWDFRRIQDKEIRYTRKKDNSAVYAIVTGWNEGGTITLKDLAKGEKFATKGIKEITMFGVDEAIKWERTDAGLVLHYPESKPCDHAYAFKIIPNGKLVDFDRE